MFIFTKINIKNKRQSFDLVNFLKRKLVLFSLVVLPVSSLGNSIDLYLDDQNNQDSNKPIFLSESVINLEGNISLSFSESVDDYLNYEKEVGIFPNKKLKFDWNENKTKLDISSRGVWDPGKEYILSFPKLDEENESSYLFSFEALSYPEIIKTNPEEREQGFVFDEENSIFITFDKDVSDFDVQLISRPFIDIDKVYDQENKTLKLIPKEKVKNFGSYTITVFIKHNKQDDKDYFPVGLVTFNTLLPTPENWPKEFKDRLTLASQSTVPKIKTGKYVDVNLDAQITTLFEDGKFVKNFINSAGAKDTPTPKGEFEIYDKHPYALSNMFQVYMPYWMAFTSDGKYGFHDFPVWPEGHPDKPEGGKESERNVGKSVSPGCVRHSAQDSKEIYNWADVGTKVLIY